MHLGRVLLVRAVHTHRERDDGGVVGSRPVLPDALHGRGLGRAMVRFAEERCRAGLGLSVMRIELLFPTAAEHAFKVRLAAWYSRMGYAETANSPRSFFDAYPAYAPLLAGACDYRVYEKRLVV